jgi:glyoxylase-like metal-dependent hydrolase (beta-lactamase superfamily II)
MKIFHLDCGTMYPPGGKLLNQSPAKIVCHCLLIETANDLVLVDAGVGTADMQNVRRLGPMRFLLHLKRDVNDTAAEQVKKLGYRTEDVRHIMITHLDLDHAGGLPDFPQAAVHVLRPEYEAAMHPEHFKERERYRRCHFTHDPRWIIYDNPDPASGDWFGLKCIAEDNRLPEGFVLVPLPGHTRGHCGVAVKTPDRWLFHAGDAYYHKRRMEPSGGCTAGFMAFEYLAHINRRLAMQQVGRLRQLVNSHHDEVDVFCTHDPYELEKLALNAGKGN